MAFKMSNGSFWARVLILLCLVAASAAVRLQTHAISSGGDDTNTQVWHSKWEYLKMVSFPGSSVLQEATEELKSCEENYGFFPCSTTFGGNLFLLIVYGYLLLKAAQCLSNGSELLLTVLTPGIIGGLLLPILGAMPDALLILVSGLSATNEAAQSQVLVGMGLLSGSNIMLLSALWGSSLIVGRCDLEASPRDGKLVAKDRQLTKGWSLTGTGVTTDQQTRVASWIMIITVLPYLVAQAPVVFGWSAATGSTFVLVGCVIAILGLASYCTYQVVFPWIQQRTIYRARRKVQRSQALHKVSEFTSEKSWGHLLHSDGVTPNRPVIGKLFHHFDSNEDNVLSKEELKGLITKMGIDFEGKLPNEDEVATWMEDFDLSHDENISEEEFTDGMIKWMRSFVDVKKASKKKSPSTTQSESASQDVANGDKAVFFTHNRDAQSNLRELLSDQVDDDDEDDHEKRPPTKNQVIVKAVIYLITGALIAGIVADPLVDAISNFSTVTGISPFFISFVATPLATNSSEAISSLLFAMKRKKKNISMTYSQIYGGVTMNNTMCLAIFLAIVYTRGLKWDFSSEVLVILVATIAIGVVASVRVTFPLWTAIIFILLYPFSIALVAVLDYGFGWQ